MVIEKSKLHSQLLTVLDKLEHYKMTNNHLQFEVKKQNILRELTKQENSRLTAQIERLTSDNKEQNKEISFLKDQNRRLERPNEEFKKILTDKDEEMSHLKSHNKNLEDNMKKSKNDKKSPHRSNIDLEEEIKCIRKLIMDKDNELAQV